MGKIYVGDIGKKFKVDTQVDCSTATLTEIHIKKPDGTNVTWTATVETNEDTGVDSILTYTTTQASELDQVGLWKVIAYVEFGSTSHHYGEPDEFTVFSPFE